MIMNVHCPPDVYFHSLSLQKEKRKREKKEEKEEGKEEEN